MAFIRSTSFCSFIRCKAITELELLKWRRKVDNSALKIEKETYLPVPIVKAVTRKDIMDNYAIIKQDVQDIVEAVIQIVLNDPSQLGLIVKK